MDTWTYDLATLVSYVQVDPLKNVVSKLVFFKRYDHFGYSNIFRKIFYRHDPFLE